MLKEGRTWRHNSSWLRGRAVLEESSCWARCHYNTASNFSSPHSASWHSDFRPYPAVSSIPLADYSNIHSPLCHSTLFICFIFLCSLPFSLTANHQTSLFTEQIISHMNSLNFLLFFSISPALVFQMTLFFFFWVNAWINKHIRHYLW